VRPPLGSRVAVKETAALAARARQAVAAAAARGGGGVAPAPAPALAPAAGAGAGAIPDARWLPGTVVRHRGGPLQVESS
jgi:hypothetical protein